MELFCSWRLNRSSHASLINVTGWLSFYKYLCVVFSLHLEWFNAYTVDRIRYTVLPEIEINLALWNFKKLLTLWNVDHVLNLLQKLCVHYGLSVIYVWIAHVGPQLNVLLWHNFHRSRDDAPENNPRRLRPGKVSPRLSVPNHIQRPPYVNSRQQRPGMNNGPEIHDEKGIECMRASGKLAAQVLKFAGTLVKVMSCCYKSLILSISKLLFPLDKPHSFYSF